MMAQPDCTSHRIQPLNQIVVRIQMLYKFGLNYSSFCCSKSCHVPLGCQWSSSMMLRLFGVTKLSLESRHLPFTLSSEPNLCSFEDGLICNAAIGYDPSTSCVVRERLSAQSY